VSNLQVCAAAVGLMGDLCRALGVKVLPYCDETMVMLLENLGVCMSVHLIINTSLRLVVITRHWAVGTSELLMEAVEIKCRLPIRPRMIKFVSTK